MAKPNFRLNSRGALVAMISAAFANPAMAATAGRVDFVIGEASLRSASGQVRTVTRGSEVLDGDTLVTGAGRAQVRFSDGAFVSLQPNTEFGVREYRYEGKTDGSERGLFSLVRGAMRTVTGAIGRTNRAAYQVRTPTATVGIRGTGGLIEILADLSTLIKGTSGIWLLANQPGQLDVPAGTQGIATPNLKEAPKPTGQLPQVPPAPLAILASFSADEVTTAIGEACVVIQNCSAVTPVAPPMASGPGYHIAFAFGGSTAGNDNRTSSGPANATFNATGQMTMWNDGGTTTLLGTHAEGGNVPGVVAWGRWTGPVAFTTPVLTFGMNEGLHYVAGMPSASLPTGTATYNIVSGATNPTQLDGLVPPGTFNSGSITADFLIGKVGVALNVTVNGSNYQVVQLVNPPLAPSPINISGSTFSGGFSSTQTGTACASGCATTVNGFFSGTLASHAGMSYQITGTPQTVTGTVVFAK